MKEGGGDRKEGSKGRRKQIGRKEGSKGRRKE